MVKRETVIVLLIGIVFIWFGDNPTIQIPLILLWLALAWSDHEKKKREKEDGDENRE